MRRTSCSNSPGGSAKRFCFSRTSPRTIGGAVTASAPRSRQAPKLFLATGGIRAHELPTPGRDDGRHGAADRAAGSHVFELRAKRADGTPRLHYRPAIARAAVPANHLSPRGPDAGVFRPVARSLFPAAATGGRRGRRIRSGRRLLRRALPPNFA